MLGCTLRVKTDWRNRLANEHLNHNLRINEEQVSFFYISNAKWYNEKVRNLKGAKLQKYLGKQHQLAFQFHDFEEKET